MRATKATRPGTRAASSRVVPPSLAIAALLVLGYLVAFILIADIRLHRRVQDEFGVNIHGYRGPVARQTRVEDRRILMLGGALAFGSGLVRPETVPAYLERNLNQKWRRGFAGLRATVVGLAGPGDGPASYLTTLGDFAALGGDVVCLLGDPAAPDEGPALPWRHRSLAFRLTGYFPLLPDVLSERSLSAASIALRPPMTVPQVSLPPDAVADCAGAFRSYCDTVAASVDYMLGTGRRVLVARPPLASESGRAREEAVAALLGDRFGARSDFRYVDLSKLSELSSLARPDGLRLTALDSDRVADSLTTPLLELMR